MNTDKQFRRLTISSISFWLGFFVLLPLMLMLMISFFTFSADTIYTPTLTAENYFIVAEPWFLRVVGRSMLLAGMTTLFCLLLAYPLAYFIAQMRGAQKQLALLLLIIPFWTSALVRTYALSAILKVKGLLNGLLLSLGLISQPFNILYSDLAVLIGLVYNLLPFMTLPLYSNIEQLDKRLLEAARDLGASPWVIFQRIILPLSYPGILSGIILVFFPAMTLFYIPDLLGGARSLLLGNLIQNQFLITGNWPQGSAASVLLTLLMAVLLLLYWGGKQLKSKR